MSKTIEAFQQKLCLINTTKVTPAMLGHIKMTRDEKQMLIAHLANILVEDHQTLSVKPWDSSIAKQVEKAIAAEQFQTNLSGDTIYVKIPSGTQERRLEIVKKLGEEVELTKIAIRNVRRHALAHLKAYIKEEALGKDDEKQMQHKVQKITEDHIALIEEIFSKKTREIMQV